MKFRLTTLLLLLACGTPAIAADATPERWYQVELIVFAHAGAADEEVWPEHPELPELSDARELLPAEPTEATGPEPFRRLPAAQYQLAEAEQRMVESDDFEPLLHTGWRQPGMAREEAQPIHISTGEDDSAEGSAAAQGEFDDGAGLNAAGIAADGPKPRLDGSVRLVLSRYLHLEVDLTYREEPEVEYLSGAERTADRELQDILDGPQAKVYRFVDSRRMRSGEVHYLDHPKLGVIAMVTPYELPKPTPAVQPAPASTAPEGATTGLIRRQ